MQTWSTSAQPPGFPPRQDILSDLRYHVIYLDVKDSMAHSMLVANLSDLEHRLSLGTNDKMQLAGMVGVFQTSRSALKA